MLLSSILGSHDKLRSPSTVLQFLRIALDMLNCVQGPRTANRLSVSRRGLYCSNRTRVYTYNSRQQAAPAPNTLHAC